MKKSSPWSQGRNTPSGRKKRTTVIVIVIVSNILHVKRKRQWHKNTQKKRHLQINKRKKEETRAAVGAPAYRRTTGRRAASSMKIYGQKRNETSVTSEKDGTTSANQTPGGYKFAPLLASQQWRANQHEPACFGLSSPRSFPSRSDMRLPALTFAAGIHSP